MTTENGAISLVSSGDARVDLFSKINRDTPESILHPLLHLSWSKDPLDTLRIIFHLRDCRGGKGEREQFYRALRWLMAFQKSHLEKNLSLIPFYGRFKDFLIFLSTPLEHQMLAIYAAQLKIDLALLNTVNAKQISLAAKYAPSEGGSFDQKHKASTKFAKVLGCNKKNYRTSWLVPLRKQIDANSILVERRMTDKPEDWETIDFSKISSLALKKYKKAWERHQRDRYEAYLDSVTSGKSKMNVLRLMPHQIVEPYLSGGRIDTTIEAQWISFVEQTKKTTKFNGALGVVDVSGSMAGTPINVAVSLGLLLAELTNGPFHGKFFTFSSSPQLESVKGSTLYEKVQNMNKSHWDMSTNIQAVFDTLLSSAKMFGCTDSQMPKTIFIFSDMQFDVACGTNISTNWHIIKAKYQEAGYTLPRLVFWNLRGNTVDFPVSATEDNVALISGFSADLLKMIIDGDNLNPVDLMLKVIRGQRYSHISLAQIELKETNAKYVEEVNLFDQGKNGC